MTRPEGSTGRDEVSFAEASARLSICTGHIMPDVAARVRRAWRSFGAGRGLPCWSLAERPRRVVTSTSENDLGWTKNEMSNRCRWRGITGMALSVLGRRTLFRVVYSHSVPWAVGGDSLSRKFSPPDVIWCSPPERLRCRRVSTSHDKSALRACTRFAS